MRFQSFRELLTSQAEQSPEAPALRYGQRCCSYAELKAIVEERAAELKAGGRTCLGVLADGSFDCVVSLFAANLAGLQVVMLDANAPEELLRSLIAYTDADQLWGDEELCEELAGALTPGVTDGAGRILSRTAAKAQLSLEEYRREMAGVYTTSVSEATLDEAPMAYKRLEDIIDVIRDSVDVIEVLRPIYNFKAE